MSTDHQNDEHLMKENKLLKDEIHKLKLKGNKYLLIEEKYKNSQSDLRKFLIELKNVKFAYNMLKVENEKILRVKRNKKNNKEDVFYERIEEKNKDLMKLVVFKEKYESCLR